jgi:hypothetical protein
MFKSFIDKMKAMNSRMTDIIYTPFGFWATVIGIIGLIIIHYVWGIRTASGNLAVVLLISFVTIIAGTGLIVNIIKGIKLRTNERIATVVFLLIVVGCLLFAIVLFRVRTQV